jgi:putative ABC transport system substrate-binding protein
MSKDCQEKGEEEKIMKRWKWGIGLAMLTVMLFLTGNAFAETKVLIVPGLAEEDVKSVDTYAPFFKGLEMVLAEQNILFEYEFVALDGTPDEAVRASIGKEAVGKIKTMHPDVLVAVNDNVVKYVAMEVDDIPVVAGFFFGAPEALGLPTANITGVARRSFAVDIWSMAKQLTGAETVSLLSKNSFSMAQIRAGLLAKVDDLEKLSGVRMKEMYLCDTFDEWKTRVNNWSEDIIYLADVSRIHDGDKEVSATEVVQWTVANAKVPVVGANEEAARDGALFAITTSEELWGQQVGKMVVKIVTGTPVSGIPMETVMKGKLLINAKTAMNKNIEIPYEILNSADHVFE